MEKAKANNLYAYVFLTESLNTLQYNFYDLLTQMNGLIHCGYNQNRLSVCAPAKSSTDEREIMMISCMSIFQRPIDLFIIFDEIYIECVFALAFNLYHTIKC